MSRIRQKTGESNIRRRKVMTSKCFCSAVSNDLIKLSNGLVDIEKVNTAYNTSYISALDCT